MTSDARSQLPVLAFRRATEADLEFLIGLRQVTMWPHFESSGLAINPEEQLERVKYRIDCARIITCDGADVGLFKVVRDADPWELTQIQLMPRWQGQGIGAALIRTLLVEASGAGRRVHLDVLRANPAKRLYERLGFRVVAEDTHSYLMRFDPVATLRSD
jgi:ribosomal protein S18 acetylase RimI-like enzyme